MMLIAIAGGIIIGALVTLVGVVVATGTLP